jgi:hypothetical protein
MSDALIIVADAILLPSSIANAELMMVLHSAMEAA